MQRQLIHRALARFECRPGDVRGHEQIRDSGLEQRAAVHRRLLRQHVDGRAAEIAPLERCHERFEIDERAARGVDERWASGFISASSRLPMRPVVAGVIGQCRDSTSAMRRSSSRVTRTGELTRSRVCGLGSRPFGDQHAHAECSARGLRDRAAQRANTNDAQDLAVNSRIGCARTVNVRNETRSRRSPPGRTRGNDGWKQDCAEHVLCNGRSAVVADSRPRCRARAPLRDRHCSCRSPSSPIKRSPGAERRRRA